MAVMLPWEPRRHRTEKNVLLCAAATRQVNGQKLGPSREFRELSGFRA